MVYQVLHVASVLFLTATIFAIFAGAPESKRKMLSMLVGVLTVLALVGGFGLATALHGLPNPANWPFWMWGKVVCWLGLAAIGGMAWKRRGNPAPFIALVILFVLVALILVYTRPVAG
ncbi:MAG TPA: hypothetical protein VMM36_03080 [Opitutaceae bacterium]|nr:hypothetical protein [Opitutaceae bacterium]